MPCACCKHSLVVVGLSMAVSMEHESRWRSVLFAANPPNVAPVVSSGCTLKPIGISKRSIVFVHCLEN